MNHRPLVTSRQRLLSALALAICLASGPARAQVEVVVGPPPAFVATTAPVYFEGRPAYWYGGRWCYREGPRWGYYRAEPAYLRTYRGNVVFRRRGYGYGWRR